MPDENNNPVDEAEAREAALRAGWDGQGPVPRGHGLPPAIDPELGNNGVERSSAERLA